MSEADVTLDHEVEIVSLFNDGRIDRQCVAGRVIGGLAVHIALGVRPLAGGDWYAVTHVLTGMRAAPMYFGSLADAVSCAKAMNALPFDWSYRKPVKEDANLRDCVWAISNLCGGLLTESVFDQPAAGQA